MASRIHTAKKRSSHPNPLNADTLSGTIFFSISCFSTSLGTTEGGAVDNSSSSWDVVVVGCESCVGHFGILTDCQYIEPRKANFCQSELTQRSQRCQRTYSRNSRSLFEFTQKRCPFQTRRRYAYLSKIWPRGLPRLIQSDELNDTSPRKIRRRTEPIDA